MLSKERLELGKMRVGASEIGALILDDKGQAIHPYLTPLTLWQRKVEVEQEAQVKRHLDWGNDLEQPILRRWAADNEAKLRGPAGQTLPSGRYKYLLATPDDFVEQSDGLHTADAKNVQIRNSHIKEWGAPGTDEAPLLYIAQVAIQIEIAIEAMPESPIAGSGYLVASLGGAPPDAWIFQRDAELVGQMDELAARFVRDCVQTGRPPDKWWNDPAASEYVARRYREANAVMLPADAILRAMGAQVAELRKRKGDIEKELKAASALLCSQIGSATGIEGVAKWSLVKESRAVVTDWEGVAREIAPLLPKDKRLLLPDIKEKHTAERTKRKAYRRLYVNGAPDEEE